MKDYALIMVAVGGTLILCAAARAGRSCDRRQRRSRLVFGALGALIALAGFAALFLADFF